MVQTPRVSIIASLFRSDAYIESFLVNMARQIGFGDGELILGLVGGSETEYRHIGEFMGRHDNCQLLEFDAPKGIYATWNACIEQARGEFITNANVDDIRLPWATECMARELAQAADIDVVYGRYLVVDEYSGKLARLEWEGSPFCDDTDSRVDRDRLGDLALLDGLSELRSCAVFPDLPFSPDSQLVTNSAHCAPMWRNSLHDRFGLFDESYHSAGDYEFWVRCAVQQARFRAIPEILTVYYSNPEGMSTRADNLPMCAEESERAYTKWVGSKPEAS